MSRVAKKPITLPKGVEFNATAEQFSIKGPKGSLSTLLRPLGVEVEDRWRNLAVIAISADSS
jgi:large subunit ribosomal protein L6